MQELIIKKINVLNQSFDTIGVPNEKLILFSYICKILNIEFSYNLFSILSQNNAIALLTPKQILKCSKTISALSEEIINNEKHHKDKTLLFVFKSSIDTQQCIDELNSLAVVNKLCNEKLEPKFNPFDYFDNPMELIEYKTRFVLILNHMHIPYIDVYDHKIIDLSPPEIN